MSNRVDVSEIERVNIGVFKDEADVPNQPTSSNGAIENNNPLPASSSPTDTTTKNHNDLNNIYDEIKANKKSKTPLGGIKMDTLDIEDKPDPGFRVYHVHKETQEVTEVPPYTSPGEHLKSLEAKKELDKDANNNDVQEEKEHAWGE